jgi:hypothetical protein
VARRAQRGRGLRDAEIVQATIVPSVPPLPTTTAAELYLLRPEDFVHPSRREEVAARAEAMGGRWVVTPPNAWQPIKVFRTAYQARVALRAAGFKGPQGKGTSSRWVKR